MNNATKSLFLAIGITAMIFNSGCTTDGSNAETGAVVGAIAGAVIGGIIGQNMEDGSNDYYKNHRYYEPHGRYYRERWVDDGGGATGALIGAAAGAMIGGMIGHGKDVAEQEQAAARAEEYRYQRELAMQREQADATRAEWERQRSVSRGMTISENEVVEAEQRAREAELRLQALRRDRIAALKRDNRLNEAEERRLAAEAEIERLERELAGGGFY
jgi:uncharacterized protein YcfJ